jgi:hypothetical protein
VSHGLGTHRARQGRVKLITCLLFSFDPDLEPETRRVGILTMAGHIPEELAPDAVYLGSFLHPQGLPVSVYEFPVTELVDGDLPVAEPLDVMAAIEKVANANADAPKVVDDTEVTP